MSGPRGERDLCKKKNPWQRPFKLIEKNKYANEKKKRIKKTKQKTKQSPWRFEPGENGIGGNRLKQWATQTPLIRCSNLQYIKCYHNSKYQPSVFSAIFRHKQPHNVTLKQLALLKWIYYGTLEKTFAVYQRNACKSITDESGRAGSGENDLCQKKNKTLCRTRPARHASLRR